MFPKLICDILKKRKRSKIPRYILFISIILISPALFFNVRTREPFISQAHHYETSKGRFIEIPKYIMDPVSNEFPNSISYQSTLEVPNTFNDSERLEFYLDEFTKNEEASENSNGPVTKTDYVSVSKVRGWNGDPVVSIVTPAYNPDIGQLKELHMAILHQTIINWEWIIVDDGSDVKQVSAMKDLAHHDSRIFYYSKAQITEDGFKNVGKSRNLGVQFSKSNLIFFIDSDDHVEPTGI